MVYTSTAVCIQSAVGRTYRLPSVVYRCMSFYAHLSRDLKKKTGKIISGAIMVVTSLARRNVHYGAHRNVGMLTLEFHRNVGILIMVLMSTEGRTDGRTEL